jgi:hypothetical protein
MNQTMIEAGEAGRVHRHAASQYEKPSFTVYLVIFTVRDEQLHVLLVRVEFDLAFDHAHFLADAVERLRSKLEYTHIAVHLLPEEFTLPELQRTYEIILQQPLDKSSFRRRVAQADMLEELAGKQRDGSGRPAQLYRFRDYDRQTFFPRSISRHAR